MGFGGSIGSPATPSAPDNRQQIIDDLRRQLDQQSKRGRGYVSLEQNPFERAAGVTPPGYEGIRDRETGQLLSEYQLNPFSGEASQRLRTEALGTGPSEWAKAALQRQRFEQGQQTSDIARQQQMQQSGALSNLSRFGGLGGGARTSLAKSGARDALMARQNAGAQGIMQRYGINESDAQRRQGLLGNVADIERQADLTNQQRLLDEINRRATFDSNRYNQQMSAWGAKQTADATRAAGSGGGGKK